MICGMERWPGGWDLFCSEGCFSKEYPTEHPTRFPTITDYYEALDPHGLGLPSPYMGGKHCFTCGQILYPQPTQQYETPQADSKV